LTNTSGAHRSHKSRCISEDWDGLGKHCAEEQITNDELQTESPDFCEVNVRITNAV